MAEIIETPFGFWVQMGSRIIIRSGVQMPYGKGKFKWQQTSWPVRVVLG